MFSKKTIFLPLTALALSFFSACALFRDGNLSEDFTVYQSYGTNMVLQAGKPVRITGTATPGKCVKVTLSGKSVTAKAGVDGIWNAVFPSMKPGGPHEVRIAGADREIVFRNVLFGEVWLCSGQSNMAMAVKSCLNPEQEIAQAANYPEIRLFKAARRTAFDGPLRNASGSGWEICSPASVANFSAAGYFFGRKLHQDLRVPIGLIDSAWGGTPIQPWISRKAFESTGMTQALSLIDSARNQTPAVFQKQHNLFLADFRKWEQAFLNSNPAASKRAADWKRKDLPTNGWTPLTLPGNIDDNAPFQNLDGIFWIRKTISLPPELAGQELVLKISRIDDCDETFFNGVKIGQTGTDTPSYWNAPRNYRIPGNLVQAGENTIAIRVIDHASGAAVGTLRLCTPAGREMDLAGKWLAKLEFAIPPGSLPPRPLPPAPRDQNTPAALYNAMIAPWTAYPIRGVIWYQGESNVGDPGMYMKYFPLLIQSWRKEWNDPDQIFLFVQLSALERHQPDRKLPPQFARNRAPATQSGWAEIREVQEAALLLPNTGMAVTIDIGDPNDIHPRNKQEVGRRLALEAERIAYSGPLSGSGKSSASKTTPSAASCGPIYDRMKIEGNKIRLFFRFTGRGLTAKGGKLHHFAIAGSNGKFVWANAEIDGDTVLVWSPSIQNPRTVRYAWANYPSEANLYNLDGFPASPFRTDKPDYLIK